MTVNITTDELGVDRRTTGRASKRFPAAHVEEPTQNVIEWQRRQLEPLDRYLSTQPGSVEALKLLEGLR